MRKILLSAIALAAVGLGVMLAPTGSEATHNTGHCGGTVKDETSPFAISIGNDIAVTDLFIKAGSDCVGPITENGLVYIGNTICYYVTGIGSDTVTAVQIGSGPICKGISHIEANTEEVITSTPTPSATPTIPASPESSPTPVVTITPTPEVTMEPSVTPIPTPIPTPTPTMNPMSSPTPVGSSTSTPCQWIEDVNGIQLAQIAQPCPTPTNTPTTPTPSPSPIATSTSTPPVASETPSSTPTAKCQEDEPCWDCETMGNNICGPVSLPPTGGLPNEARAPIIGVSALILFMAGLIWFSLDGLRKGK